MTNKQDSIKNSRNVSDFNVRFGDLFSKFNNPLNIKMLANDLLKEEVNPFQKIIYQDLVERCDACVSENTALTIRDLLIVKKKIADKELAQKMAERLFDETPDARLNGSSMQAVISKGNKSAFDKFSPGVSAMDIIKVGKKDVFLFSYIAQKKKKKLVLSKLDELTKEDVRKILDSDAQISTNNDASLLLNIVRISPEITKKFISKFKDTLTDEELISCIKKTVPTFRLSAFSADYNKSSFTPKIFSKELFDLALFLYASITPTQYRDNFSNSFSNVHFNDNFVKYVFDVPVLMNTYVNEDNSKIVATMMKEISKPKKLKVW